MLVPRRFRPLPDCRGAGMRIGSMDRTERFYKINQQLDNGHYVSFEKWREP